MASGDGGVERAPAFTQLFIRERDHEDAVGGRHADAHDCAHHRFDVEGGVRQKQHPQNARERAGQRRDDNEGISPRLEINDHQEINERRGENETEAQFAERAVHAFNLAAHVNRASGRKFGAKLVYDFCDLIGNATEIGALHIGIDVEHRLHIGVADVRWCFIALERDQIAQQLRMRRIVPRQRCRSNGID